MRTAAFTALIALITAAAWIAPAAGEESAPTLNDIRSCMQKNLVSKGALRDLHLKVTDREKKVRELRLKLYWKPEKNGSPRVNLRILEPMPIRGSSYLLLAKGGNEEVYFYLPGADRALKITGKNMSEPLWGTDFSYGEIKQLLGLVVTGDSKLVGGGKSGYTLEVSDPDAIDGYRRVVSHVEKDSCVLLKSEFFAKSAEPAKILEANPDSVIEADGRWLVLGYTMRNLVQGTSTVVTLTDFSIDERMPERVFDAGRFFESYQ